MQINNITLSIGLFKGCEYSYYVSKIVKLFEPNTEFCLNSNNQLIIYNPNAAIESFTMYFNSIEVVIADQNDIAHHLKYVITKIEEIISITNIIISNVRLNSQLIFTEADQLTGNFKEKIFKISRVKCFSLILNEIIIHEQVKTNTKIFTGTRKIADSILPTKYIIYVFENEVFLEKNTGGTLFENVNLLYIHSIGNIDCFLRTLCDSIQLISQEQEQKTRKMTLEEFRKEYVTPSALRMFLMPMGG